MSARSFAPTRLRRVHCRAGALACTLVLSTHAFSQQPPGEPLSLEAATRAALERSAKVVARVAAFEAAAAVVDRSFELPDPKLRFGLENLPVTDAERFRYDRDFMTMQRIGVMQTLPHGDKRSAARLRARTEALAEQAELAQARVAVRREAALAWIDHAYARRILERLEALERELGFELEATAPALVAGRISAAEIFGLRGMREQVRDRHITQERMIDRAQIELARLVGDAARRPPGALPDTELAPLAPAQMQAHLARHPAVLVAAAQIAVAQAEVDRARAGKSADWAIELSFARREPAFSNMVSLMFQRDLPLWPERRQDRDVAARVAAVERVRAIVEDTRRTAEAELRLALADHASAQRRVAHHEHGLLANARERTAAAAAAYRGGRGSLAAVPEARRAETEIAIDTLGAERDRARAWVNLRYALLEETERAELDKEWAK